MRLKLTILMASVLLASSPAGASIEQLGDDSLPTAHGFPPPTAGVSSSYGPDDTAWKPVHTPESKASGAQTARLVASELLARKGARVIAGAPEAAADQVPEPSSLSVLLVGLLGAGAIARRRLSS